jgi:hypothetical protein
MANPEPIEPEDELVEATDESTRARRIGSWQRALRWVAWLTFIGLVIANSDRESFDPIDLLALAVAIGVSIWSLAKPLGGPRATIDGPADVLGPFVSRANWGLVVFGVALTVGGIGATGTIVYDLSTNRATIHDVFADMGTFVVGSTREVVTGWSYDAHLEGTHAYGLFMLLVPGLLIVWWNLVPFLKRGREFRVGPDTSIWLHGAGEWYQLLERKSVAVAADGTTIRYFTEIGGPAVAVLPQARVFSRETGARLRRAVSGEFFRQRLTSRGFTVEVVDAKRGSFSARRA